MPFQVYVSIIVCIVITGSLGQTTYTWNKVIDDKLTVREFAVVEEITKTILMSATDSCLSGSKYLPTLSLHDFETGQVALKRFSHDNEPSVCYIQPVASNYSHTIRQLKDHQVKGTIELGNTKYTLRKDKLAHERLSKPLKQFCSGLDVYSTTEVSADKFKQLAEEHKDAKQEFVICIILVVGFLLLPVAAY